MRYRRNVPNSRLTFVFITGNTSYKVPVQDEVGYKYGGGHKLKRVNTEHRRSSCVYEPTHM